MDYESTKPQKMSDLIMERIGNMIVEGTLKPGQKLPPERELAERFKTSRPSLRGALHKLEAKGLITRIQGGGTYVAEDIDQSFTDPLLTLLQDKDELKYDLLEYRHALEETACRLAAQRATDADRENIQSCFDEWMRIHEQNDDRRVEAEADYAFHLSIAEASHNVVLPHAMRSLQQLMKHGVEINLKDLYTSDERRQKIREQHTAMLEAVLGGDAEGAKESASRHLDYVRDTMENTDTVLERTERAERRNAFKL